MNVKFSLGTTWDSMESSCNRIESPWSFHVFCPRVIKIIWSILHVIPLSLRQPHSGTSSSISDSHIPSHVTSSSSDSPLCSSITPSLTFGLNLSVSQILPPLPVVSLLPPGLCILRILCCVKGRCKWSSDPSCPMVFIPLNLSFITKG